MSVFISVLTAPSSESRRLRLSVPLPQNVVGYATLDYPYDAGASKHESGRKIVGRLLVAFFTPQEQELSILAVRQRVQADLPGLFKGNVATEIVWLSGHGCFGMAKRGRNVVGLSARVANTTGYSVYVFDKLQSGVLGTISVDVESPLGPDGKSISQETVTLSGGVYYYPYAPLSLASAYHVSAGHEGVHGADLDAAALAQLIENKGSTIPASLRQRSGASVLSGARRASASAGVIADSE